MAIFPFTALVDQDTAKEALLAVMINPAVHGVLFLGPKGTGKTTLVRSLGSLVPDREILELPIGSSEDMVLGSVDAETTLATGQLTVKRGLLTRADQAVLYIDEVNLLPDHLVDVILDAAATGSYRLEREGISATFDSKFTLIGSMNPEEGWLRPQLLDRFGLAVHVQALDRVSDRAEIFTRASAFQRDPEAFCAQYESLQHKVQRRLDQAAALLPSVFLPDQVLHGVIEMILELGVCTHRAELVACQAAMARAALQGRGEVLWKDVQVALPLALQHRLDEADTQRPLHWDALEERIHEGRKERETSKPGWLPSPFYRKKKAKQPPA